jgi:hypothetical protein
VVVLDAEAAGRLVVLGGVADDEDGVTAGRAVGGGH